MVDSSISWSLVPVLPYSWYLYIQMLRNHSHTIKKKKNFANANFFYNVGGLSVKISSLFGKAIPVEYHEQNNPGTFSIPEKNGLAIVIVVSYDIHYYFLEGLKGLIIR